MELQALLALAPAIREWFESLRDAGREHGTTRTEAITALYTALNETRIYLGTLAAAQETSSNPLPRDRETEANLSRLWTSASIKLRPINRDLAVRCLLKGDSWAVPDNWPEDTVRKARIDIEQVFSEARKLI